MSFKKGIINSLSLLLFAVICAYFAWSTRSAINSLSDIAIHLRYDNRTSLPLPGLTICYDGANLTFSCKYNATVLNNTGTNADCYITKYMLATIPNVPAGLTDNFDRCYVLDPALAPNLTRGMMAPLALIETPFQMSTAIQYTSSFAIWAPGTSFVDSLYLLVPMWNSNINFQRRYVTYSYSEHQTIDKSIRTSLQYRTEFFPNDVKEDVFGFVVGDWTVPVAVEFHPTNAFAILSSTVALLSSLLSAFVIITGRGPYRPWGYLQLLFRYFPPAEVRRREDLLSLYLQGYNRGLEGLQETDLPLMK